MARNVRIRLIWTLALAVVSTAVIAARLAQVLEWDIAWSALVVLVPLNPLMGLLLDLTVIRMNVQLTYQLILGVWVLLFVGPPLGFLTVFPLFLFGLPVSLAVLIVVVLLRPKHVTSESAI
jgi:hypothetical protein